MVASGRTAQVIAPLNHSLSLRDIWKNYKFCRRPQARIGIVPGDPTARHTQFRFPQEISRDVAATEGAIINQP